MPALSLCFVEILCPVELGLNIRLRFDSRDSSSLERDCALFVIAFVCVWIGSMRLVVNSAVLDVPLCF